MTKNKVNVRSLQFFEFEGQEYLGVSGDGGHFEAFTMSGLSKQADLSKLCLFILELRLEKI